MKWHFDWNEFLGLTSFRSNASPVQATAVRVTTVSALPVRIQEGMMNNNSNNKYFLNVCEK
jgi:hypothetical protein